MLVKLPKLIREETYAKNGAFALVKELRSALGLSLAECKAAIVKGEVEVPDEIARGMVHDALVGIMEGMADNHPRIYRGNCGFW
jgi:hypothetical protein